MASGKIKAIRESYSFAGFSGFRHVAGIPYKFFDGSSYNADLPPSLKISSYFYDSG